MNGGNAVRSLATRSLRGPEGDRHAIMLAADVADVAGADSFIRTVMQQVQDQRMISPPDTALLLVTLMGAMSSADFARCWQRHLQDMPVLAAFMDAMETADVVHGTREGAILDSASLR